MLRETDEEGRYQWTVGTVASFLGIAKGTVRDWAKELKRGHGEGPRPPRGDDLGPRRPEHGPRARALPALDLLLQGVPQAEIARSLRRTRQAISRLNRDWLIAEIIAEGGTLTDETD